MEKKKKNGLLKQCPVCGGKLSEKTVEKLLRGGNNIATLMVEAQVCLKCGKRIYALEVVQRFENIRKKLKTENTKGFKKMGSSYTLAA